MIENLPYVVYELRDDHFKKWSPVEVKAEL